MRNVFDQYEQPENRLSHALASCLHEDEELLRDFLRWLQVNDAPRTESLIVDEQTLPGELLVSEDESERRGLPDIVIHDGNDWCVLIESKVQAGFNPDQLRRHRRTMERRGFSSITLVTLTKEPLPAASDTLTTSWPHLYKWLGSGPNGRSWRQRLRQYLRAAEVRLSREGYLSEGTLTMFDGYPFATEPYTYGEAKRLLRLTMNELRADKRLITLGMDPEAPGRPAITGRSAASIWDYLQLKARPKHSAHTAFPHLTLAVHGASLNPAITIPNGVARDVRHRFGSMDNTSLQELHLQMLERSASLRKLGAEVGAEVLQRHYRSQRSAATRDASCGFRLETSVPNSGGRTKFQPEWCALLQALLRTKRSNIQCAYVVTLPWTIKELQSRTALDLIVESWRALSPLIEIASGKAWRGERR